MGKFDDQDPFNVNPRPPTPKHEIGEPLDTLSVAEFDDRLTLLRAEILRLEVARLDKVASLEAAGHFFKH